MKVNRGVESRGPGYGASSTSITGESPAMRRVPGQFARHRPPVPKQKQQPKSFLSFWALGFWVDHKLRGSSTSKLMCVREGEKKAGSPLSRLFSLSQTAEQNNRILSRLFFVLMILRDRWCSYASPAVVAGCVARQ